MNSLVKGLIVGGIFGASLFGSFWVSQVIPAKSAQTVFNRYGFDPGLDVKFSIEQLQNYSIEVSTEAHQKSVFLYLLIWGSALGSIALVVSCKPKPRLNKRQLLLKSWESALKNGDTFEQAKIELELKDLASERS